MMQRSWLATSCLELGALPGAVPCARLHARQILWEWRNPADTDVVELVVSELVTNAISASVQAVTSDEPAGVPPVRMRLSTDARQVLIEIWDGHPALPDPRQTSADAESGRGLLLVGSLCADWGVCQPAGSTGKTVWALIAGEASRDHEAVRRAT